MAFGDLLKGHLSNNDFDEKYKSTAWFFITECGWSQEMYEEADIEFMQDIIEYHTKVMKQRAKKKK